MSEGVERMITEIVRMSREEAQKIILASEKEAERMILDAENKAKEIVMDKVRSEVAILRRRAMSSASLKGRKMIMKAKDEAISKVFDAVEERLRKIAEGKDKEFNYEEILFGLIKEAVEEVGEVEVIVAANEKDLRYLNHNLDAVKRRLKKELGYEVKLRLADRAYDCVGGVVVYNPEGDKTFYNTLEGRWLKLRDVLRGEVGKVLFG